ncbi:MAG: preprotein translocase subunit SecG [Leptonema sp. (in: bacteria)]
MELFQYLIVILFLVVCFILIFFILIQSGKGGSLGILGGSASNTPFGASTVDIVEKITWWGVVFFFVLSLLSAVFFAVPKKKILLPEEEKLNLEENQKQSLEHTENKPDQN